MILKIVKHKPYNDLQVLLIFTIWLKNVWIDFVTRLYISTNWKGENYDFILVIVDWLAKIIYNKLIKVAINVLRLAIVIINIAVWHYGLLDLIISNKSLIFILKFWLSFCYFFGVK